MQETKRHRETAVDKDEGHRRKILRTTSHSSLTNETEVNSSVARLEDLPDELIRTIFDYLDGYYVYYAFSQLNQRLRDLLFNATALIDVDTSGSSKTTFQNYYTNFLQWNKHRIRHLHLPDPFITDFFSSSTENISKCSQLQTLVLSEISSNALEHLLAQSALLPQLSALSLRVARDADKATIYTRLFQLPALKRCQITFNESKPLRSLPVCVRPSSLIESLSINDSNDLHEVHAILSYVPHVRCLTIKCPGGQKPSLFLMLYNDSTRVLVVGDRLQLDKLDRILRSHSGQIKLLQISLCGRVSNSSFSDVWKKPVLSYLPHLQISTFESVYDISCPVTCELYNHAFGPSRYSLCPLRQWSFTHEPMSEDFLHKTVCPQLTHR